MVRVPRRLRQQVSMKLVFKSLVLIVSQLLGSTLHRSRYSPFAAHLIQEGPLVSEEGREV